MSVDLCQGRLQFRVFYPVERIFNRTNNRDPYWEHTFSKKHSRSQPQEMDPTCHYFLIRSCPGSKLISFVRDSKEKEKATIIRDGIQGESARLIEV
ncbi:hypothetical protein ABFA07_013219 [Porites harrisoni]